MTDSLFRDIEAEKRAQNVSKLERQLAQLKERMLTEKTRQVSHQRKAETKRKILLGALCMAWMEKDPQYKRRVDEALDAFLTKDVDRRIFGLATNTKPAKRQPPHGGDSSAKELAEEAS